MWKSEGNAVVKKVLEAQLARQEFAHAYLFLGEGVNSQVIMTVIFLPSVLVRILALQKRGSLLTDYL